MYDSAMRGCPVRGFLRIARCLWMHVPEQKPCYGGAYYVIAYGIQPPTPVQEMRAWSRGYYKETTHVCKQRWHSAAF
eukprot:scaffold143089_cov22-Tisochrysis_lutea.AAC.1